MASKDERRVIQASAGRCATCHHARPIITAHGSVFVLCERPRLDRAYDRYPRLPVLACAGFDPAVMT